MENKKLKFKVVYASGEDRGYPSSELNQHTRDTKGWQTTQYGYIIKLTIDFVIILKNWYLN